jgi:hypothetical protein
MTRIGRAVCAGDASAKKKRPASAPQEILFISNFSSHPEHLWKQFHTAISSVYCGGIPVATLAGRQDSKRPADPTLE